MDFNRCYGCMRPKTGDPICQHCGYQEGSTNGVHQLPVGTVLKEQYTVGKVLGQGGFGITYLGWDMYLDIPVAIKEYFPSGMVMRESTISLEVVGCGGDDGSRFRSNKERFLREAKMLARFSKVPEIVQIRNFFLANNTAYIVMEYVEGITLKQYVRDMGGKLSVEETLSLLGPVMEALSKVHKTGLVHRDISPDNIMMLPEGGAKLLDFGAVRDVGAAAVDKELTKSTEAILKQGYAPIEQYQKRGSLGPWTDVYALCATIYYCLTGEAPADAPERLLMEEELELETKIPELTAQQRAALEHGLALRTDFRTGSMEQLQQELLKSEIPDGAQVQLPEEQPVEKPAEKPEPEKTPLPKEKPVTETKPEPIRVPAATVEEKREKTQVSRIHTEKKADTSHNHADQKTKAVEQKPRPQRKKPADSPTVAVSKPARKPAEAKPEEKAPRKRKTGKVWALAAVLGALVLALVLILPSLSDGEEITVPFIDKRIKGSCGNDAVWTLDPESGELVISGRGSTTAFASMENNDLWQSYREQITSLTVKEGISRIGAYSFSNLPNLKTVTLSEGVRTIGNGAFQRSGVESLKFTPVSAGKSEADAQPANGLTSIGSDAFRETALTNVVLPDTLKLLGSGAFAGCDQLTDVTAGKNTIPSFNSWDENAFADTAEDFVLHCVSCSPMSQYAQIWDLPAHYFEVGNWDVSGQCGDRLYYHFNQYSGLLRISGSGDMWDFTDDDGSKESWRAKGVAPWKDFREEIEILIIDDGITYAGQFAFAHCRNLKQVHWGNGLQTLAFQSFMDTGMEKVMLPASIQKIEHFAFNWCDKLEEIHLPENLVSLEEDAIAECRNLKRVWMGQKTSVKTGWNATPFSCSDNESNTTVYKNLTIYGMQNTPAEKFASDFGYQFAIGARDMIAEDQGQCGDNAWWFRSGDNLVLYGTGATWKFNLSTADVEGWAQWEYQSGRAFTGHPGFWTLDNKINHVIILPGLEELGNGLFIGMYNIVSVDFGTISKCYAHFSFSNRLKELVFPETLKTLGSWTFQGCSGLREVTFLGPTVIEEMAFDKCYGLKDIWFYHNNVQFRSEIFPMGDSGTANIKENITFHVKPYSAAESYAKRYDITYEVIE